jgi:hypothetical protein
MREPAFSSHTKVGLWLERHGWKLESTEPHGFAETHYWRSPHNGWLHNQTYALMLQREKNRADKSNSEVSHAR